MPNQQQPIEEYVTQLSRRLHLPAEERDGVLAEIRGHLEERAAGIQGSGISQEQAERQAVQAFGTVLRISRQLRAAHPRPWGPMRWTVGIVTGAVVTWALWLAGTVPVTVYYFTRHPVYVCPPPGVVSSCYSHSTKAHFMPLMPIPTLAASSPLNSSIAYIAYLTAGWLWVLPFLVLYLVLPFLWGRRAQPWWMPGIAYGLGTWLSAPWFVLGFFLNDWAFSAEGPIFALRLDGIRNGWAFSAEARLIVLALPLALVASFAGWFWRERPARAVARALAA